MQLFVVTVKATSSKQRWLDDWLYLYTYIYIYILVWLGKIIWYMIILYDDLWPTTSTKLIYHSSTMIYHPIKCQARGKSDHLQRGRQGFSMTGRCFFWFAQCGVRQQTFPGCNMIFLGINQSETNLMVDLRFFWNSHFLGAAFFVVRTSGPQQPNSPVKRWTLVKILPIRLWNLPELWSIKERYTPQN